MYISENSGHHHASLAIEKAFHMLSDDVEVRGVNSFHYTNPILEKIVNRTYMSVIKNRPEVWGYLYDNPKVVRGTQRLKESIHRYNSGKMKKLIDEFMPDAVACTQAFPCGIIADYKKSSGAKLLLAGVLTDYAPHSYWIYDSVDMYFVPSEETGAKLAANGVAKDRIQRVGIPIDPKFNRINNKEKILNSLGLSAAEPVILVMGGSQGIGPMIEIARILDGLEMPVQVIAVTGNNKKIYAGLKKIIPSFRRKFLVFGYTENIDELMEVSSFIISKPGGITVSEALSKALPILIVDPIPGHEAMNTEHLVKNKVAIRVENLRDLGIIAKELLSNSSALANMKDRAKAFSSPDSASRIARAVLTRIM
ncbi:MAG: glycosyltransferase [Candidatus Omnitrophota bacterium]